MSALQDWFSGIKQGIDRVRNEPLSESFLFTSEKYKKKLKTASKLMQLLGQKIQPQEVFEENPKKLQKLSDEQNNSFLKEMFATESKKHELGNSILASILRVPGQIVQSHGEFLERRVDKKNVNLSDILTATDYVPGIGLVGGTFLAGGLKTLTKEESEQLAKKYGKEFVETTIENRAKNLAKKETEKILKEASKKELNDAAKSRLLHLFTYQDTLSKMGYNQNEIARIDFIKAKEIIDNKTTARVGRLTVEDVNPFSSKNVTKRAKQEVKRNADIPFLEVSRQSQDVADISAISGGGGRITGFKALATDIQNAYQSWVNKRLATRIESVAKQKEFSDLDRKGIEGLLEFQGGVNDPRYQTLRRYFDKRYIELKDAGLDVNYKQGYLTQIWQNSEAEVDEALGRSLGLKPSFTLPQVIKDYKTGIEKGLTPKFSSLSQVAGWYESRVSKALADREFFGYLAKNSLIQPSGKAPQGWVTLSADKFPKYITNLGGGNKYAGTYKAPPDLAKVVNNYLDQPDGKITAIANVASTLKNVVLSAGIPGTALNFHGVNIWARNVLARKNPVVAFFKGMGYLFHPGAAKNYTIKNLDNAIFAAKHGLTISTEEHLFDTGEKLALKTLPEKAKKTLFITMKFLGGEKQLFNEVIPAIKLQHFEEIMDDLVKSGMDKEAAAKSAATTSNSIFGGINWQSFGRSRDTQDFLRATILAPDWAETQFKILGGMAKGLVKLGDPEYKAYRTITRNLALAYSAASYTNKLTTGHWMHENEPSHTFEIAVGQTSDGKDRYLRPFGTAADFIRLPYDIILSFAAGDPTTLFRTIKNRLSVPASVAMGLLTNVDYKGQAIYGSDKYGHPLSLKQSAGGIASEVSRLGTPPQASAVINLLTDRINAEQFAIQLVEAPIRYSGGYYSESGKAYLKWKQLKEKSPEEATKYMDDLQASNPALYREVGEHYRDDSLNVTSQERKIRSIYVYNGDRAAAVAKLLKKYESGSPEWQAKIDELIAKKVISEEVYNQLGEMRAEGKI